MPIGYRVGFPSGGIAGFIGMSVSNMPAMDEEAARELIQRGAERLGLSPEDFELLPFETDFVEGFNAPRMTRLGPEGE